MKPVERTWTVRGYEVDATRTTRVSTVLSYLEQLRWEWMADPEWGLAEGIHDGHFFVVRRQILELVERPRFGDVLTVSGSIQKIGRTQILVRHLLTLDGNVVGQALVTGIWLGPNRRLAKLPDRTRTLGRAQASAGGDFGTLTGAAADAILDGNADRSFLRAPQCVFRARGIDLTLPEQLDDPSHHEVTVRPSDCDVFVHVNASTWLDYADDARLAAGHLGILNRVAIDYAAEALVDEVLQIACAPTGPGLVGVILSRDAQVLCRATLGISDLNR